VFHQLLPVIFAQYGAAARRKYDVGPDGEFAQYGSFALAKTILPLDFKNDRNLDAGATLDFLVAVIKGFAEPFGEQAAYGCLTGTHQTDKKYVPGNAGDGNPGRNIGHVAIVA
jgi:hypothetical protein